MPLELQLQGKKKSPVDLISNGIVRSFTFVGLLRGGKEGCQHLLPPAVGVITLSLPLCGWTIPLSFVFILIL